MALFLSLGWLAVVVWLICRAAVQRTAFNTIPLVAKAEDEQPYISIILPARDEEPNVAACLEGLLTQHYPNSRYSICVVDDHSSDATAAIVLGLTRRTDQVRLLSAPELPAGWIGKPHACWVGACAIPAAAQWLCFIDADVRAKPLLLSSAIHAAVSERIDLLSLMPMHELGSFAERLILPCGMYLLAFRQDIRKRQTSDCDDVSITGQFILIKREAYEAIDGHRASRNDICEDAALAQAARRSGYIVKLRSGEGLLSIRMYAGWASLWPGLAKNLVQTLGGPFSTIVTAAVAVILVWAAVVIPAIDAVACAEHTAGACSGLVVALLASAAAFGLHVAGAAHFGIPLWYGLLFPLGYTVGALLALDSVRWRWRRRVIWKGRTYP